MKQLDLMVFGSTTGEIIEALEFTIQQLRRGDFSDDVTFEDGSHVSFDIRPLTDKTAAIYEAYTGLEVKR
jgi:hypothetical protein